MILILKLISLNSDYSYTYILSVATIITNLAVAAIFSRFFSSEAFLEFNVLTRYFGFFIALGSGSVGYALIYYLKKNIELSKLYSNAVLINFCIVVVVTIIALMFGNQLKLFTDDQMLWFFFCTSLGSGPINISHSNFFISWVESIL